MSGGVNFVAPASRGAAIHPLLLAVYHSCPTLRKAVLGSSTGEKTLSKAMKSVFSSLEAGKGDATPVWNLIGESVLLQQQDAYELFVQICDLLDSELDHVAERSLGYNETTNIVSQDSGQVLEQRPAMFYALPVSVVRDHDAIDELLMSHYSDDPIDYAQVGREDEPILAAKQVRIKEALRETLVVHLQRYRYDFTTMSKVFVSDRIAFTEAIPGNFLGGFADSDAAKDALGKLTLSLQSIVTHSDVNGYAFMIPHQGKWKRTCLDGAEEEIVDLEHVFGGSAGDETAYLLFFRVEGGSTLAAQALHAVTRPVSQAVAAARKSFSKASAPPAVAAAPAAAAAAAAAAKSAGAPASGAAASPPAGGGGGCCVVQ